MSDRSLGSVFFHLAEAVENGPRNVTHVGVGKGRVEQVASNRRIIGPDGMSKAVRWSATKSAEIRAEPEGLIDVPSRHGRWFGGSWSRARSRLRMWGHLIICSKPHVKPFGCRGLPVANGGSCMDQRVTDPR